MLADMGDMARSALALATDSGAARRESRAMSLPSSFDEPTPKEAPVADAPLTADRLAELFQARKVKVSSAGENDGRPVELVGVGAPDQRWEMRTGETADGMRIVHLVDQSGNYAAEKMRVDFVANASHELRTPLASILGFIETLNEEAGEDPALRARFLKVMFDEARRMQRLVEDLISLSRIEAEKYRLPGERLDLGELLEDVAAEIAAARSPRAGDVSVTIDPGLPPVTGDEAQLSQLFHNVIGNAMKYGRANTPVRVSLSLNRSKLVQLVVRDEGEGIAPQHIPRLTERFYRVDSSRSRQTGGTGLGLSLVKHIVFSHGGEITLFSQKGVGSTFTVKLPRYEMPAEESAA